MMARTFMFASLFQICVPASFVAATLSVAGPSWAEQLVLPDHAAQHVNRFDTSFEECAPMRNSAANEWSAFGVIGNVDINAMGRDLRVRYPAFDLVFRIQDQDGQIKPDTLDSFRLGLVNNRLPAVWGAWKHGNLLYRVSVMTVPDPDNGNFDLYKLEIQNPSQEPQESKLVVGVDGPPDMALANGVVTGLQGAAFLVVDNSPRQTLVMRDYGLCDKRAKASRSGPGPGQTEEAITRFRLGLAGLPVVYRFKAGADRRYVVCLATTPHISGYLLQNPQQPGDLIYQYDVEGCEPKTLDYIDYVRHSPQPLCVRLDGAHDCGGDGYVEVRAGVTKDSRIRHTRLSVIYVFPEGTDLKDLNEVYSGALNDKCVWHIDVGVTPEQDWTNQHYDQSDVGIARLNLTYGGSVNPGEIQTYWLKVPPIHRRQPVSMGYIAHAFRDVLPGEAVPPFSPQRIAALRAGDSAQAEKRVLDFWERFFARAARLELPDPVLNDIYLSRLATRAIMNVTVSERVVYNACSPFFYFDHAYRDHAYVVLAYDLAGMHDDAELLLEAYCRDVKDIPTQGPISFDGKPLQLGMHEDGLWHTRPGQWDTQGQNIWALVQHYKLSGRRDWLEKIAYSYARRGAMWLVNSRHKHMKEVGDPNDPRYGLLEPGAMEVQEFGKGVHMYYLNGFGVLGLREAADAARALGREDDANLFTREAEDLRHCLLRSFRKTFKRTGLYEGHLWFGVEPQGVGMYGFWAHNCLLWPCRCIDPHDPMLTATLRKMEMSSRTCGGGMHSEGVAGSFWPYIGVDRAVGYILRGEPDLALDYFCAYVDTAGGTFSWGEGYTNVIAAGDQPHCWADAQYVNLLRHLFVMEDGATLLITPALFRRWHVGPEPIAVHGLATHFGDLELLIQPSGDGARIDYRLRIAPQGDQQSRPLEKLVIHPRTVNGRPVTGVLLDGQPMDSFTGDRIVVPHPPRDRDIIIELNVDS